MPGFNINGATGGERNTIATGRAHRWRIIKLGPIDGTKGLVSGAWYAKSFTFPTLQSQVIEALGSSIKYKFAGSAEFTQASVTFYEAYSGSNSTMKSLVDQWISMVHGSGENMNSTGFADEYKSTSEFELESEKTGFPIFKIKLHGSWPSKVDHTQLSYAENSISEVTVDLTFDWYSTPKITQTAGDKFGTKGQLGNVEIIPLDV